MNARRNPPPRPPVRPAIAPARRHARRGTVIVVVIALLGALMLLGFLFLTLTMQEETSGEVFRARYDLPAEKDPDVFFNWALEQLIVGPPDTAYNSVLYSGYKSLLPNMVGADLAPYDGTGIGTAWRGATNRPELDLDRDGVVDVDEGANPARQWALQMNFSPGAQTGDLTDPTLLGEFYTKMRTVPGDTLIPAPDADFTYPDLNSAFLSYDWIEPVTGRRVVIPSFHRPQLLRNRIAADDYLAAPEDWTTVGSGAEAYQVHPWYTAPETLPFVMRPHLQRRVVAVDPENPGNFSVRFDDKPWARRFVTASFPDFDDSGLVASDDPTFVPPINLAVDREPIWRVGIGDAAAVAVGTDTAAYANSYDADPDNDGIFDAIWLDLDFPIQPAGDGVGQFVPLWALKVVDVDALFNLNAHGNSYGSYADADSDGVDDSLNLLGGRFIGNTDAAPPLSQSGPGRTQDEVNPQYALSGHNTATASSPDELEAFSQFYDRTSGAPWTGGAAQSRNLEWWFLLHGRVSFQQDPRGGGRVPDDLLVGRYGEPDRLREGALVMGAGDATAAAFFPYPGLSANAYNVGGAGDDNYNALEGLGRPLPGLVFGGARGYGGSANPLTMTAAPEGVPLDRRGSGFATDAFRGLRGLFLTDTNPAANGSGQLEDGNVRFRFPTLMNAVLPLFDESAGQGFANTGAFSYVRDWFAATGLQEGRTWDARAFAFAMTAEGEPVQGTATAPLTGQGAAGGSMVEPTTGATGAAPAGRWAASLYGAAAGQANDFEQYHRLQIDEPAETIRDFDQAQSQSSDAIFAPAETARLHMTDADYRIAKTNSRLLTLAPVSFSEAPEHERIRRRFTTVSWDVATTSGPFEPPIDGLESDGAEQRAWEHTGNTDDDLTNETSQNRRQFPPVFGSVAAFSQNDPFRAPVRSILGQAVTNAEPGSLDAKRDLRRLMRKLSFNQVAERVTNPADPLFDRTAGVDTTGDGVADGQGEVRLRTLTPHPIGLEASEVVGPTGHPARQPESSNEIAAENYKGTTNTAPRFGIMEDDPIPGDGDTPLNLRAAGGGSGRGLLTWDFSNLSGQNALRAQEWHARRDRQNLARDIYVLLYTVGGVDPTAPGRDYTQSNDPVGTIYSEEQLREMAQLAVNIVDAMDPDPVRTLFVYDKNLGGTTPESRGYTPYDDGYANPPDLDPLSEDYKRRGMVAGVERQELALSEAMATIAWAEQDEDTEDAVDHELTEWNELVDDDTPHDFGFFELLYTGAGELNFASGPVSGTPGENVRLVIRDPRNKRDFRERVGAELTQDKFADRAIVPRIGRMTAAQPYFTIANADKDYATAGTQAADEPRSRLRVNFTDTSGTAGTDTADNAKWVTLAPRPFDQSTALPLPDNPNSQVLDTLRPGAAGDRAFWVLELDETTGEATAVADPADAAASDLLNFKDTGRTKRYENTADVPVVEALLQVRLNPLRRPARLAPKLVDGSDDPDLYRDQNRDNPWITIDRMRVMPSRLDLYGDDENTAPYAGSFSNHFRPAGGAGVNAEGPATANPQPKLASRVRREPLLRASELGALNRTAVQKSLLKTSTVHASKPGLDELVFNSIGGHDHNSPRGNDTTLRPFALWQPHYDREFAGPADVIGVPLYDAESLTGLTAVNDATFGSGVLTSFQEFSALATDEQRQIGLGYDKTPQNAQDDGLDGSEHAQPVLNEFAVAGSRLLYPDVARAPWQGALSGGGSPPHFNTWYRLLQYVGTPRRLAEMTDAAAETVSVGPTDRLDQDGTFDLGEYRLPGRINLNTLRHPEVLAGLIDDLRVHGSPNSTSPLPMTAFALTPAAHNSLGPFYQGDLYRSLLLSRDGRDPLRVPDAWDSNLGGYADESAVLPGIALRGQSAGGGLDGNPFTGFHGPTGTLANSKNLREALQSTPLRLRPQAQAWVGTGSADLSGVTGRTGNNLPRAFFGVGGAQINHATDEASENPPDLDFTTRYRLLNKVLNSATHRSNVFLCWIQVDFFHARELTGEDVGLSGAEARQRIVRIGGKRGDSPRYRGVFLIDRSKAPALLRADHLPEESDVGLNTYSFAREPLSGGAKFPWQELILHRQRIQ